MHYLALACDYDGTLAKDGVVSPETIAALERVRASGRKLILVTGRLLDDLKKVFPHLDLFISVVAENGTLLYHPADGTEQLLAKAPPKQFLQALQERGVTPLVTGRVIVVTWHPYEGTVVDVIGKLGLEEQVIFNKGAVMILPSGVNKGTGLMAALHALKLSAHNVVGVGDAENDHSFLNLCECAVAVANALPALKAQADYTTQADHGAGAVELIEQLLSDDLKTWDQRISRHTLLLGNSGQHEPISLRARRTHVLIAGSSGSGKSTVVTALLEQLGASNPYQFCLIDPEGDYETFHSAITLGDTHKEPAVEAIIKILENAEHSVIVNLLAMPVADRAAFLRKMLPALQEVQTRSGHPHWLILDEAHHLLAPDCNSAPLQQAKEQFSTLFITAHPTHVCNPVLESIDVIIAVGTSAGAALSEFCQAIGQPLPRRMPSTLDHGDGLIWFRRTQQAPQSIQLVQPREQHQRHRRKYAEGDLGEDISFYFRGPEGKLRLRAQNLVLFRQIAEGVDEQTWLFHLHRGDYSRWLREVIKDTDLAAAVMESEQDEQLSASESRSRIIAAIEQHYTQST